MPWKETCSVDERVGFIAQVNAGELSFSALCRAFGVSRKTGYKWIARYEEFGPEGLLDRSSVAGQHPHATPEAVVTAILELRKQHATWGPKKLKARLEALGVAAPAASTVGELLKKHGLIRPRRRRVYPPRSPSELAATTRPNDTWCTDFKGHFALGDKSRCYPLTITDQVSRYLLKCEGVAKPDTEHVRPHFERAFHEFGMPIRIRSDNGPPFATTGIGGLSALSVWWIKLGITPERIEPGKPQQNGRHERMHKTLGEETANPSAPNAADQQRAFDRFRAIYNDERPHEALDQSTPASHYERSPRPMPAAPKTPEYPDRMKVRKLDQAGSFGVPGTAKKRSLTLTALLKNEHVGLDEIDDGRFRIYFGPVVLADVDVRNKELRVERVR